MDCIEVSSLENDGCSTFPTKGTFDVDCGSFLADKKMAFFRDLAILKKMCDGDWGNEFSEKYDLS